MSPIMIKVVEVLSDSTRDVWINASLVVSVEPSKAGSRIYFVGTKYGMNVYHAPDAVAAMIKEALAEMEKP